MHYRSLTPEEIRGNVFSMIGKDWMLITAGDVDACNTMTASWGGMGILWGDPVAFAFVRPQRYTFEFMERTHKFTLSFFGGEQREALALCGSRSGRDCDKIALAGLTPVTTSAGYTGFREATLILECETRYADFLRPEAVLDPAVTEHYPTGDYHKMYIGKIVRALVKE